MDTTPQKTTQQPIDLSLWITDTDRYGPELFKAIRDGNVIVTTKAGFEKIREQKRADTIRILDLASDNDDLIEENTVLLNTLVYVLMSFKGVAGKAPEIFDLMEKLGVQVDTQITAKTLMMKFVSNPSLFGTVFNTINNVVSGFDASFMSRIDAEKLIPILENVEFDFSNYKSLIDAAKTQFKKLPENGA